MLTSNVVLVSIVCVLIGLINNGQAVPAGMKIRLTEKFVEDILSLEMKKVADNAINKNDWVQLFKDENRGGDLKITQYVTLSKIGRGTLQVKESSIVLTQNGELEWTAKMDYKVIVRFSAGFILVEDVIEITDIAMKIKWEITETNYNPASCEATFGTYTQRSANRKEPSKAKLLSLLCPEIMKYKLPSVLLNLGTEDKNILPFGTSFDLDYTFLEQQHTAAYIDRYYKGMIYKRDDTEAPSLTPPTSFPAITDTGRMSYIFISDYVLNSMEEDKFKWTVRLDPPELDPIISNDRIALGLTIEMTKPSAVTITASQMYAVIELDTWLVSVTDSVDTRLFALHMIVSVALQPTMDGSTVVFNAAQDGVTASSTFIAGVTKSLKTANQNSMETKILNVVIKPKLAEILAVLGQPFPIPQAKPEGYSVDMKAPSVELAEGNLVVSTDFTFLPTKIIMSGPFEVDIATDD